MPQLSSGRHIAISADPIHDNIAKGKDGKRYAAILVFRLTVHNAAELRNHMRVAFYHLTKGTPSVESSFDSGFSVADVLNGKADFSDAEVDEFRHWLDTDPRVEPYITGEYQRINQAILHSPVFRSPLLTDEGDFDMDMETK